MVTSDCWLLKVGVKIEVNIAVVFSYKTFTLVILKASFLEQRQCLQLTLCKESFVVLGQDGRRDTRLSFCFTMVRT